MTRLLTDVLHDRAESLEPPAIDLPALLRAGERRVARRRLRVAGGTALVAAGLTVAGVAVLQPDPGASHRTARPDPLAEALAAHAPSYAAGRTVHLDDDTLTVSHDIRAYVQTELGIVYADPDGTVYTTDGHTEAPVGQVRIRHDERVLAADGTIAAWVESTGALRLAVLDQATGEVRYTPLEEITAQDEFTGAAAVWAVDGSTVYASDERGVLAVTAGAAEVLRPRTPGGWVSIDDVKAGVFAFSLVSDGVDTGYRVGGSLDAPRLMRFGDYGHLSPDGSVLVVEESDGVPAVFDTGTGARLPVPSASYDFQVAIGWVDGDHYASLAIADLPEDGTEPPGGWRYDLLTCSLAEGDCTVTETDLNATVGESALPIGADITGG